MFICPSSLYSLAVLGLFKLVVQTFKERTEKLGLLRVQLQCKRGLCLNNGTHPFALPQPLPGGEDDCFHALERMKPLGGQCVPTIFDLSASVFILKAS